jgi:choline dehydrogenase
MVRMVRGVRAARRIYNQEPLKRLIGEEIKPGAAIESDADLEAFVRRVGAITQHPVGTCKMGMAGDATAVVDADLRVRGVSALRVIDASIMPNVPAGNTNAPTIMIAEKGAESADEGSFRRRNLSRHHPQKLHALSMAALLTARCSSISWSE